VNIEFVCPQCRQNLTVDTAQAGTEVSCPSCSTVMTVPPAPASPPPPTAALFCPKCGERNGPNRCQCLRCGFVLRDQPQPQYVPADNSGLTALIPYRNVQALWAYYLGVFSLIPCLGAPMGIAALVLGIRALKYAKLHPEAKGKAHAWTGIIAGGFFGTLYLLLIVFIVVINLTRH
jgi:hypothetical protein